MINEQFLELLRCGMYRVSPDLRLFEHVDWDALFQMSVEQTVVGVVLDGVELLSEDLQPATTLKLRWVMLVRQIEIQNEKLDNRVIHICDFFSSMGLSPMVIKGQVISRYYPYPNHRQAGDIDLFFTKRQEVEKANIWAKNNTRCYSVVNEKELAYRLEDVIVENHIRLADMQYGCYQDKLQKIIQDELIGEKGSFVKIREARVRTLPATLTVLHLIIHIQYHLLNEGLGWRQMCDLAMVLNDQELIGCLDRDALNSYLSQIGLKRMSAAIGYVLFAELGLSRDKIPFDISSFGADIIVNDIWTGGNFGKKRFAFKGNVGFVRQKIIAMPLHWRQYRKYRKLIPNEALANFLVKFKRVAKGIK